MSTEKPHDKNSQAKPLRAEILPLLLSILATTTVEIAQAEPGTARWKIASKIGIQAAIVGGAYRVFSHWGNVGLRPGRYFSGVLIALGLLPFLLELLGRSLWNAGNTLEFILLAGLRNLVCGMAVLSYLPGYDRICCVISMFLMIFSSTITSDPLVHGLVVVFALCGIWWLMGIYWDSLRGHLVGSAQKQFPKRFLILIPVLLLLMGGLIPFAAPQVASALPGFMPSSGGDRWSDGYARSGVNDGDALVPATDDARSFGPVETDVFLESTQPSLYDVFNEMYGNPPKNRKQDRSIALPPEYLRHAHERIAKQKQIGREFSTVRRSRPQNLKPQKDVTGSALLYVGGRTPLHLRLEVFDLFDGVEWFAEDGPNAPNPLQLKMVGKEPWVRLPVRVDKEDRLLATPEAHQLKIINLQTNRIPSPPALTGIHIDKVDKLDMFAWAQDSIVKMDRETLPDLTVIHVQSRAADPQGQIKNLVGKGSGFPTHRQLPVVESLDKLTSLARSWTTSHQDDWPRIKAVISRLRTEYVLDRDYKAPENCSDTVGEFLFQSKRGSDYMFASSAAMLLRSMGYSVRVVSGFYADPLKFELKSRHTPVYREDVHFWPEVYAGPGIWITLEPTPGYEVLLPPPGFWQRCLNALLAFGNHILVYWWIYLSGLALAILAWIWRAELCDGVVTLQWRHRLARHPRQEVLLTLRLLEQRGRWAGISRRPCQTAAQWLRELEKRQKLDHPELMRKFAQASDWAHYGSENHSSPPIDVPHLCRHVVQYWTLSRLRGPRADRAAKPQPSLST